MRVVIYRGVMVAKDIESVSNSRKKVKEFIFERGISGKICRQGIGE